MVRIVSFSAIVLFCSLGFVQSCIAGSEGQIVSVPLFNSESAILRTNVTVSPLKAGANNNITLLLQNQTDDALVLKTGKGSCSCTSVVMQPQKIAPNEEGVIDLDININSRDPRVKDFYTIVIAAEGKYSLIEITLEAKIEGVASFGEKSVFLTTRRSASQANSPSEESESFNIPIAVSAPYTINDLRLEPVGDLNQLKWRIKSIENQLFAVGTLDLTDISPNGISGVLRLKANGRDEDAECQVTIADPPMIDLKPGRIAFQSSQENQKELAGVALVRIRKSVIEKNPDAALSVVLEKSNPHIKVRTAKLSTAIYRVFFKVEGTVLKDLKEPVVLQMTYGSVDSRAVVHFE
jgi:hypothetical protein